MSEQVKMGEIFVGPDTTVDVAGVRALEAYADREAAVIDDKRLTFGELSDRIGQCAAGLHELGIGKGDVVVLLLPTSLEFIYLYWAIGRVGGVVAPVNPVSELSSYPTQTSESISLEYPTNHASRVSSVVPVLPDAPPR